MIVPTRYEKKMSLQAGSAVLKTIVDQKPKTACMMSSAIRCSGSLIRVSIWIIL